VLPVLGYLRQLVDVRTGLAAGGGCSVLPGSFVVFGLMFIAIRDLWRSKLRFALLAGAIALLVFLLLFLSTLSATLLGFFVGAIENNSADVLVYEDTARGNVQASRLDLSVVGEVAAVPGVAAAAPIGELTLTVEVGGVLTDLSLWGVDLDGPGGPSPVVEGRSPGPGEVVMDLSAVGEGFEIGEIITLVPSGTELKVVGYVEDVRYAVMATAYLSFEEWTTIYEAEFPSTPFVPLSLVGVEVEQGEDPTAVGDRITAAVDGVEGLDRESAASGTPGVESISQSFSLIVGITFGIVVLVVGFFFLILTVQKMRSFTILRAIGTETSYLAWALIVQIVILVALGSLIATGALWAATLGSNPAFPLSVDVGLVLSVTAAVLVSSSLAGLLSIRRIAKTDPAEAAQGTI
jgi:putative ABC transport system permease protein